MPSLLLMLLGFAVYFNVLGSPFYLDDLKQIVNNEGIKNISNIPTFFTQNNPFSHDKTAITGYFYKPVFYSVYSLLYFLGNGSPFTFHLFQVLIFSSSSVFVFLLFSKFFGRKLAFLLALIFLAHPANEEVAQYIAAIQDALFFWFGIMAVYLVSSNWAKRIQVVVISSFLIFLALLSKETGVLFLLVASLYIFLFQRKLVKSYAFAFSIVCLVYLFLRVSAVSHPTIFMYETSPHRTFAQRLVLAPKVINYYFEEMFIPKLSLPSLNYLQNYELKSAIYPYLGLLGIVGVFGGVGVFLKKYFEVWFLKYAFFFVWMLLGIGLHSHIIELDIMVASRWIYFTMVGVLGMLGVLIAAIKPYFSKYRVLLIILYLLYFSACIYGTERLNMHRGSFGTAPTSTSFF